METEKDAVELLRQTETEAYEELGRLGLNDPNRKDKLNEAIRLTEARLACEKSEQDRLNSYAKNEMEERRLDIDEMKVGVDKARVKMEWWRAGLYLLAGFGSGFAGYMMDGWFQKDKTLGRLQERLHDMINKK